MVVTIVEPPLVMVEYRAEVVTADEPPLAPLEGVYPDPV
jgi:hypothetical protein